MPAPKRDQVWQRQIVARAIEDEAAVLAKRAEQLGVEPAIRDAFERADVLVKKRRGDFLAMRDAFALELVALELGIARGCLEPADLEAALTRARAILDRVNVGRGSRLANLQATLYRCEAGIAERLGDTWRRDWCLALAGEDSFEAGLRAALRELSSMGSGWAEPTAVRLDDAHRARLLRQRGDPYVALQEIDAAERTPDLSWERALCQAQLTGDLGALIALLRRDEVRTPERVFTACLWSYAIKPLAWIGKVPGRSVLGAQLGRGDPRPRILDILAASYDADLSVEQRLARLSQVPPLVRELAVEEDAALALYAVARALVRMKQRALVAPVLGRLKQEIETRGTGYAIALDLIDDLFSLEQIETGGLARAGEIGRLTLRIAQILGPEGLSRLLFRPKEMGEITRDQTIALADVVTDTMARLKGPLMKTGQLLSSAMSRVPEEVEERFASLQRDSVPVAFSRIVEVLEAEYAQPWREVFTEIDPRPLGVGTIGQVHRARLSSGEEVAIKVQYPGIEEAVANDLRLMRVIVPILDLLAPAANMGLLFEELARNLADECDYLVEATSQAAFHDAYGDRGPVRVPRVHSALCRKRVLVSALVSGAGFREWLANADEAARSRAGQAVVWFVVSGLRDGFFNTDPHAGNYLFDGDAVWFVDFGSVKRWGPRETAAWSKITWSILDQDLALFETAVRELGFVLDPERFKYERAFETLRSSRMAMWAIDTRHQIAHDAVHRQARNVINVSEGTQKRTKKSRRRPNYRLPPELLLAFRVYFGHLQLIATMSATANWHQLVRAAMEAQRGDPPRIQP